MMYLPTAQDNKDLEEVKKWLYMDMTDYHVKLRDDAPENIKKKRAELSKRMNSF